MKFRYALRWLALSAAGLTLAGAVFSTALPFLIEDRIVHDALIRSLSTWSGGPVRVRGPLRIASFTSLSIQANGVSFSATPRLSPVGRLEAKSVTAILNMQSLLLGRVEFKKIAVETPRFVFNRQVPPSKLPFFGIETAGTAAAFADRSRFEHLELNNSIIFVAEGGRRAYRRFGAARIGLDKRKTTSNSPASSDPRGFNSFQFTLYLKDQGFDAYFRGNLSRAEETATGTFRLKASPDHPAAAKIIAAMAPWEQGSGVSLSGDLTWSGARAALDTATVTFGDRSATGSIALAVRNGRSLLEGTLAYDELNWTRAGQETAGQDGTLFEPLWALTLARSDRGRDADLDMRISAEHFRAGPYEAGPLAVALTSRAGRVNIDVAELALFGGKITGRLDYDAAHPAALTVNASGTRLNSQLLAGALGWPVSVSGAVNFRVALDVPFKKEAPAPETKALAGSFAIEFPAGGTLDGEMSRSLSAAFAQQDFFWGINSSSFAFAAANIDGVAGQGGIALEVNGDSAGGHIGGTLRIALPSNAVSGTLSLRPYEEAAGGSTAPGDYTKASSGPANIVLSGTAAALNFSASGKPHMSN